MASRNEKSSIKGSSELVRMMLLTFTGIGITFTWGVEMTYCTPYLLSLGLTKSNTSLVWIAGPLSGIMVQPIVGVLSDQSTSKWGRRRPLMVIGAVLVSLSLLTLGFTQEIVSYMIPDPEAAKRPTIILAVLSIYAADFSINAIMSCSKSLIVDTLPIEKQQVGAAWSTRMSAVGNVLGHSAGAINLMAIFGTTLGDTQFKQLVVIAAMVILAATSVTCWAVQEKVLVASKSAESKSILELFQQIYSTLLHMPSRVKAICWAQFWSWIGWFPFLFYNTTWVGETYFRYDVPADAKQSDDIVGAIGRVGSTSLIIFSGITFSVAFFLPMLVRSPNLEKYTHRPPAAVAGLLEGFSKYRPDLQTAWFIGHLVFSGAMLLAPFAHSFRAAATLVAICGLPWALTLWAPIALLGVEVNKISGASNGGASYRRLSDVASHELDHMERNPGDHLDTLGQTGSSSSAEPSGIYFGILNIYATLPQFIGTFMSSIVFTVLEPGKSPELAVDAPPEEHHDTDGPNAISVCLFLGAISTLGAAYATRKLKDL